MEFLCEVFEQIEKNKNQPLRAKQKPERLIL